MEGITVLDRRPRFRFRLEMQVRWIVNRIIYLITKYVLIGKSRL